MSWSTRFTALTAQGAVERLDRERQSQGGSVPDKVVDAMGTCVEAIVPEDPDNPPALHIETHGHFDTSSGGDVHFVVRPTAPPEVVG